MNWRTTVIGIVGAVATFLLGVGPKKPETWQEWCFFAGGLLWAIFLTLSKDPNWLKRLTGQGDPLKGWAVLLLALPLLAGCSGLAVLNQNNTSEQQVAIMQQQNARGCVFFYGSAAPWATVKTVIVGTWGQNPPPYAECWQSLPNGF